jgi:N-dimethylarginine dimethylaminohydrolase
MRAPFPGPMGTASGALGEREKRPEAPPCWRRTVLMGDPTYFSVQGGANPHTRTRLGTRRRVDRELAIEQWLWLRDVLRDHGLRVIVVPGDPGCPGLVYPANAGFLTDLDAERAPETKTFYLSNLIETRAAERRHYERVVQVAGFRTACVPEAFRFEGEADFFPVGDAYLLTHGRLEQQRFVPQMGLPPWKRIYGFRTDAGVERFLAPIVAPRPVLTLELTREAHYHGDTALCAFGPGRRFLLGWRPGLTPESWERLRAHFGDHLVEISDDDAARYAANAFSYTPPGQSGVVESRLFLPSGVSDALLGRVREFGVAPVQVNVSEFLKKGGGSVKCMIGDLGPMPDRGLDGKAFDPTQTIAR